MCSCDDVISVAELHVQVKNAQAIRFYHRHAFSTVKVVKGYYARLAASDAVLLRRPLQKVPKEVDPERGGGLPDEVGNRHHTADCAPCSSGLEQRADAVHVTGAVPARPPAADDAVAMVQHQPWQGNSGAGPVGGSMQAPHLACSADRGQTGV